jgi:hypothetical protein
MIGDGNSPEALAVQEAVRAHLEREAQLVNKFGSPTQVVNSRYHAKPSELVLCNPSKAAFTVSLPGINSDTLGQYVLVKNDSDSTNKITVTPSGADEDIDNASSVYINKARGFVLLHAVTETRWAEDSSWWSRTDDNPYGTTSYFGKLYEDHADDAQAVYWEDLRVPLTSGRIGASNPPTLAQYRDNGAASVGVFAFRFDDQAVAGNEEQMWFAVQMPHGYKLGSDIQPHLHWGIKTAGAANEFVKWGLEYTWVDIDGTFGTTTIITTDASSAAAATTSGDATLVVNKHYTSNFADIDGSGISGVSSMIMCRLFRNSSHADDDLAQSAWAFEFDFHVQLDAPGSDTVTVK